jgi:REP element-mobilizing transposase RayT
MTLNESGEIVEKCWEWLENQYAYVELDAWIVMPNHLHGIILMTDDKRRGGSRTAPTKRKPLGRLIGAFKTVSTKVINKTRDIRNHIVWQRNYLPREIKKR